MRKFVKRAQKGFTLIELMIVVAIIGILAAVAIPMFLDAMKTSKHSEAKVQLAKIRDTAKTNYAVNASYPVAVAPLTPTADCCTQNVNGKNKCKGNAAGDWNVATTWQKLDFQVDEDFFFQYAYTGAGVGAASTFRASARADTDCDGIFVTFIQDGSVTNSNPDLAQLVEPPPNSD